jgi:hypothetical protein
MTVTVPDSTAGASSDSVTGGRRARTAVTVIGTAGADAGVASNRAGPDR